MSRDEEQRPAFLESIRESPDDDAPRLIFADWLDDHGDEARAEFIRVQCELARLPNKDARRPDLEDREQTILTANRKTWLGPLDEVLQYIHCTFRRGFPAELTLRPQAAVRWAAELAARVPAGRVRLDGGFGDPALRALGASPGMEWVVGLKYEHPRLTEAGLVLLAEAKGLPRLEELSINYANFTTAGIRALARSPHRRLLRRLALRHDPSGELGYPDSATELASEAVTFRLQTLQLCGQDIGPEAAARLACAGHLAELRELDLATNRIGDQGTAALARSPHLQGQSALNLFSNRLTLQGVRDLVASTLLDGIRHLALGCNAIGDEGVEVLAASPRLARLTRLDLFQCNLTDRAAEALAVSPYLNHLADLDLAANDLTDRGSQSLFDSPHLQRLERAAIGGSITGALSPEQRGLWIKRLGKGARV